MDSIFRSARLKLTLFYFIILLAMSFTLTFGFRVLAEHEFSRSSTAQYGRVHHLFVRYPADSSHVSRPDVIFGNIQNSEEATARSRLNRDFMLVNMVALVAGGVLSYWFAGRTLRPIEETHAAQARFAADASHELRTPLASMRIENEVFLRQKHFTEAEAREQIVSNLEEVQRLENLSASLLALTQYGHTALPLQPIQTKALIDDALGQIHLAATAKHVTFIQDVSDHAVLVHQDSMLQLLTIVLDNAIKYGPEGGEVTVIGRRHAARYVFEISDNGPGIAAADLPHIFERFYRGDKARTKAGGYGLGLALAQEIAEANHATITVRNREGTGATFSIETDFVK